jgi:hypothetical protein
MATNNGPPKDANPGAMWVTLTALPRPTSSPHKFRAKGRDVGEMVFWVLTAQELASVRVNADRETRLVLGQDARSGNLAYEEEYEQQKAYHLLQLAARQAEDFRFPAFPTAKLLRETLTDDEISVALIAYATFRQESGPIISELTVEEMEAWLKLLQEGASRFPLVHLSGAALRDLTMFLVQKLGTSATATFSAGSPQGESPSPSAEGVPSE